jgi:hypothetical protein
MAIKYTYQPIPFQGPPMFTQILFFWFENIPSGNPVIGDYGYFAINFSW